jgi:hypothetical protein
MIICIKYSNDGERHIDYMLYEANWSRERVTDLARHYSSQYDEVYVIDFKENKEFIDEIVLRGCRV